jgi:hypothetical protein
MFYPVEGGSVYEIPDNAFGFVYKCQLPPVGYGLNSMTGQIQETDIIPRRSEIDTECYWDRYVLPADYKMRRKMEKERQKFDRYHFDPELELIRQREWKRRLCGVWFHNYNPTTKQVELRYLTGTHYFYATYWKFQGKHMDFRINDMECWYVVKYCETDPNALGPNEITKRKLGKCFKINTLVRMYDGSSKKVQDIKDGDYVMGDDSKPRLVYGCTSGEEEMFEIVPNKGEPFTVNRSHVIHCVLTSYNNKTKTKNRKHLNLTVDEYLKIPASMKKRMTLRRVGWGDWGSNPHEIDPYFLGVWLGDGVSRCLQVTNEDEEIVEYLKQFCVDHGLNYHNCGQESKSGNKLQHILGRREENKLSLNEGGEWVDFQNKEAMMRHLGKHPKTPLNTFGKFKNGDVVLREKTRNNIWDEFKRLQLPSNKHIPREYLVDSRENRLKLLAGIVDTDGTLVSNKQKTSYHYKICLSNKYKRLQDDLVDLIRSLGFYCGVAEEKKVNAKVFTIFGCIEEIPCKIARKKRPVTKTMYDSSLTGFSVSPVGEDEYYGFAVDDNHLFLLADGTVVHNTARLGCWIYERTSRMTNSHAGLQSKTDDDAAEVFKKAIVAGWKTLPDFFRPIYDTNKGDDPSDSLRFFHPSKRGSSADDEEKEPALDSWSDFGASGESVYDGPELDTYGSDESGKVKKPVSIIERQNTVRYCSEIDGRLERADKPHWQRKAWFTTTVEIEEDKNGNLEADNYEFLDLTNMSNPLERDDNGRTMTGLYTYFLPAYKGMYFDKYGYPDEEKAKVFLLNTRRKLEEEGKTRELSSFKRKNPMTFKEAFSADGSQSLYDPELLNTQLDRVSWTNHFTEFGDLKWEDDIPFKKVIENADGSKTEVPNKLIWVPNPKGRYERVKGWVPKEANNVILRGTSFKPNNIYQIRLGCDPFRYDKTKDKRRSNCACFAYQMKDELEPTNFFNDMLTLRYSFRASSTREANMDVLKMAWWCGGRILFERNVNHWKNDLIDWNCADFFAWIPGEVEPGIITSGNAVQNVCNVTEQYINKHIGNVYFKTLIRKDTGWLGFKVEDTEKFDEPMGAGITLLHTKMTYRNSSTPHKPIEKFFRKTAA